MKKVIVKMLSVMLVVVLTITAAPLSGFVGLELPEWLDFSIMSKAAETSGACGENATWNFDELTGTLIISGTGAVDEKYSWYSYKEDIESLVIMDGITSIGEDLFYNYTNLTSVTIPDSITLINRCAFINCTGIATVNITDISAWLNITFSNSTANPLFHGADLVLNGEKVTDLIIPNDITELNNYVFYNCESITSVTIHNNVKLIGEFAFGFCDNLTSVNITDISAWLNIEFSDTYANPLCNGADLVLNGEKITDLIIPNNITKLNDYVFCYYDSLISVTIPDSVTSIDDSVFCECTGLVSVTISDSVISIGERTFYNCNKLTNITIPDSVTTIGDYAFSNCDSLTNVTIPNSITIIGSSAFSNCESLTSITIPDSVTTIGNHTFYSCESLTSIKIPDSVETIGNYAFYNCTALKELTMPASAKIYNSSNTFYNCTNIEKVTLTKGTGVMQDYGTSTSSSATNTYYEYTPWYISRKKCKEIIIEDGVKNIGSYAFYNCDGLTSITIPDSVTTIGDWAFCDCDGLISVTIPDSVTTIGDDAFKSCYKLTSVTIGDSVTTIGSYAFYDCDNLTSVIIPDSVTIIDKFAFYFCTSLTDVYYLGTEEEWNKIKIDSGNEPLLNATIHFNYCEHDYVDGTCTDCAENKPIPQEMSSQIRFDRKADGSYAKTFAVRTRAMISDEDFTELVGATTEEAIKNIDKIGFVYTLDGENFSVTSAQAVARGEKVSGYIDAPVSYVQDAEGYYMFTCLVTNIPETDKDYTLTAYAYICVNGKWYFSEAPMIADFNSLYLTYYPKACEKYGW